MRRRVYACVCCLRVGGSVVERGGGGGGGGGHGHGQRCKGWVCILLVGRALVPAATRDCCIIAHPWKLASGPRGARPPQRAPAPPIASSQSLFSPLLSPSSILSHPEPRRTGCVCQYAHRNSPHSAKSPDTPSHLCLRTPSGRTAGHCCAWCLAALLVHEQSAAAMSAILTDRQAEEL